MIVNSLDQVAEKYNNHPKTPYVSKKKTKAKKATKTAKTAKVAKEKKPPKEKVARKQPALTVSKSLASIVGSEPISRPEIVKKTWEYIKAHNCQDPKNKRLIKPDSLLEEVFGSKEAVDMMKLAGILNKHIEKAK